MKLLLWAVCLIFSSSAIAEDLLTECRGETKSLWNKCYTLASTNSQGPYNSDYFNYEEWTGGHKSLYAGITTYGSVISYQRYNPNDTIKDMVVTFKPDTGAIWYIHRYSSDGTFITTFTPGKNPDEIGKYEAQINSDKYSIENIFRRVAPPNIRSQLNPVIQVQSKALANPLSISPTMDDAKAKCRELGFKEQTEAFGKCVLRLSK